GIRDRNVTGVQTCALPISIDPAADVAVLPYSSGTTGFPKGVMLTHRNLVANLLQTDSAHSLAEGDRVMAVLPFFHIYGMQVVLRSEERRVGKDAGSRLRHG